MQLSRRDFTRHALVAGGSVVLGCGTRISPIAPITPPSNPGLPAPASSGIEHVVVVTMETRSFDHLLGWLPNAVGQQAGLSFPDKRAAAHATPPLSRDLTGGSQTC